MRLTLLLRDDPQMKSMTGYGRGQSSQNGYRVTIEVSSVNRKQAEISVYVPREFEGVEPQVRQEVAKSVSRGKVTVRIHVQIEAGQLAQQSLLNTELAGRYAAELKRLAGELGLSSEVSVEALLRIPGVMQADVDGDVVDQVAPAVVEALASALKALVGMREREGEHLLADLQNRMALMKAAAERIRQMAPDMTRKYREALIQRIQTASLPLPKEDDERLLKEVVYFADRSDISEELTRLESHFVQFQDCVKRTDAVGRMLDFLSQEFNREINTIGSKAADSAIAHEVIHFKAELEKFREQVQNLE